MSYVAKTMARGERIVARAHLHWIIFSPGAILVTIGALAYLESHVHPDRQGGVFQLIAAFLIVVGLLSLVRATVRRLTTEIVLTTARLIRKQGLLRRDTIEMNIAKIESIDVNQSLWARALNYGQIIVRGTGAGIEPISPVANPLRLRQALIGGH